MLDGAALWGAPSLLAMALAIADARHAGPSLPAWRAPFPPLAKEHRMTVTIEPAAVPAAPLAALKTYLAISLDDEDAALADLIRAASEVAERYLGQLLIARTVTQILGVRDGWQKLAIRPVTSITAVDGLPADGAAFALPVDSYAVDIDTGGTGHIRVATPGAAGRVRVAYTAGLASDAAGVPEAIRHGIIRLAGEYHARREGLEPDPPASVVALWRPWRRVQLA